MVPYRIYTIFVGLHWFIGQGPIRICWLGCMLMGRHCRA